MIENVFIKLVTSGLLEEFQSGVAWEKPLAHSVNESLGSGFKGFTLLNIQPSCFEWWNFGIAVFACVVALITCVFTIYMVYLVKKQIVDQIKISNANNEKHKAVMENTDKHVEEINRQILNNSLISIIEKKQSFKRSCDYLCDYLYEHQYLLKDGPIAQKEKALDQSIKSIEQEMGVLYEIITVFGVWDKSLEESSSAMNGLLEKMRSEDTIASDYDEIANWLKGFNIKEMTFIDTIDKAVETIKEEIKHEVK